MAVERLRLRDVLPAPREIELLDESVWPILPVLPIDTMLLFASMEAAPPGERLERLAEMQRAVKQLIVQAAPDAINPDDIPSMSAEECMAVFQFAAGQSAKEIVEEALEAGSTGNGNGGGGGAPLRSRKPSSGRSTASASRKAGSRAGGAAARGRTS